MGYFCSPLMTFLFYDHLTLKFITMPTHPDKTDVGIVDSHLYSEKSLIIGRADSFDPRNHITIEIMPSLIPSSSKPLIKTFFHVLPALTTVPAATLFYILT